MMKVVLVNNYDLLHISELWKQEQGQAPAQHLWGYSTLEKYDIQVDVLPFERYRLLKKISKKLKLFGDLDQQIRLLFNANRYDAIYSAHHLTTLLLALLRLIGILKRPIVAIAYQAPRSKNFLVKVFTKLFITGNDKILCLSDDLLRDLEDMGVPSSKLSLIDWGVDLKFYNPYLAATNQETNQENIEQQKYIFSPGKTYRDYPTLTDAVRHIDCHLLVSGSGLVNTDDLPKPLPENIEILETELCWKDFINLYRQSYAVVIPLQDNQAKLKNAIGLTAVTEAIAMGKPIIMTRNDYLGIDLEAAGIGLWVEPGDTEGWRTAITYLLAHPDVAQEMGRKARRMAEESFNLEHFSKQLAQQLQQVHRSRSKENAPN